MTFGFKAQFAKFNDYSFKSQCSKNKKPCNAGFFIEYWLQQIN
jgi:hypothetical protein